MNEVTTLGLLGLARMVTETFPLPEEIHYLPVVSELAGEGGTSAQAAGKIVSI